METIDINQALPQIKKLLEIASTGEEIIITENNQPMVKLVSIKKIKNVLLFLEVIKILFLLVMTLTNP